MLLRILWFVIVIVDIKQVICDNTVMFQTKRALFPVNSKSKKYIKIYIIKVIFLLQSWEVEFYLQMISSFITKMSNLMYLQITMFALTHNIHVMPYHNLCTVFVVWKNCMLKKMNQMEFSIKIIYKCGIIANQDIYSLLCILVNDN